MDSKQTNLCLAADVITKEELLSLANILLPEICLFKTHIDIVENFDDDLIIHLQRLAENTTSLSLKIENLLTLAKPYNSVSRWDLPLLIVPHHKRSHGRGMAVSKPQRNRLTKGRGLLVLAEMTPKGTLAKGAYTEESIAMAKAHHDFVIGFITTHQLTADPTFVNFTPGVQLTEGADKFGQQYLTPEEVITKRGCDVIIVGRGITSASDPPSEAKNTEKQVGERTR